MQTATAHNALKLQGRVQPLETLTTIVCVGQLQEKRERKIALDTNLSRGAGAAIHHWGGPDERARGGSSGSPSNRLPFILNGSSIIRFKGVQPV